MLSAFAAVLMASFVGCAGLRHSAEAECGCEGTSPCQEPTDAEYWDGCRNHYGATPNGGSTHCGLFGKGRCFLRESGQLVKCLGSYQWEGSYPHGSLGPWEGSWSGGPCCGPGSSDPCDMCNEYPAAE